MGRARKLGWSCHHIKLAIPHLKMNQCWDYSLLCNNLLFQHNPLLATDLDKACLCCSVFPTVHELLTQPVNEASSHCVQPLAHGLLWLVAAHQDLGQSPAAQDLWNGRCYWGPSPYKTWTLSLSYIWVSSAFVSIVATSHLNYCSVQLLMVFILLYTIMIFYDGI